LTCGGDPDDGISAVTRAAAFRARQRAAREMPTPDALAGLSAAQCPDMTPAQIRRLAATAIDQAQQISFLLGRLASLLDDGEETGDPG
jgi:hypothetical protein